ncbi:MAG: hypothetical protein ACREOW_03800 [Thermodesulfobacteriota bacterium]
MCLTYQGRQRDHSLKLKQTTGTGYKTPDRWGFLTPSGRAGQACPEFTEGSLSYEYVKQQPKSIVGVPSRRDIYAHYKNP